MRCFRALLSGVAFGHGEQVVAPARQHSEPLGAQAPFGPNLASRLEPALVLCRRECSGFRGGFWGGQGDDSGNATFRMIGRNLP
ncbi:MAG: hypothetical protein CSA70_05970 [Rhodobacterales bacterium]|nr:MAG: hypothetical protein CSA70_05970 [Rhodobacterales bacterium]